MNMQTINSYLEPKSKADFIQLLDLALDIASDISSNIDVMERQALLQKEPA